MKTNLIPKSTINLVYISKDKIREKAKELTVMSISQDIIYYKDVMKLFEDLLGELL